MRRILIAAAAALLGVSFVGASPGRARSDLVVHEWGTFLAMSGSDGVSLDGMYHEEHALPAFVHSRSKDQLRLRSVIVKGETPVVYFYAKRPQRVQVEVGFPGGLWTQWYPQADLVGPALAQAGSPPRARNGHISWKVDLTPASGSAPEVPATPADALWNHAREVDAAYVSAVDQTRSGSPTESERFIFYRGLGEAPLPVDVRARDGKVVVTAKGMALSHLYVVQVAQGSASYSYVPSLDANASVAVEIAKLGAAAPAHRFTEAIASDVAARLVDSGLYEKEARAMVNTWRRSYFATDGLRVLFVLPQSWTDRYIPLRMTPEPAEIVRVMVGRIEVLTPERERRAESAVRNLASNDPAVREEAFTLLRDAGRYVEPIVRHTLQTSTDARVRMLCRRLLLTDFVTELRTSLTNAATGERLPQNPGYARAQLASLLREIGLTKDAKEEAAAALAVLETMPQPQMSQHDSRHLLRALARAHEGAGNDAMALKWYGDFVQFGSQSNQCRGCHEIEGPREMSFFRDWWAGQKFAEYAAKTGQLSRLIDRHEATLARNPRRIGSQMALAYLYEARGDTRRAQTIWAGIDPVR